MGDSTDVTYGVKFDAREAIDSIERLEQGIGNAEQAVDRVSFGAQSFGKTLTDMGTIGTRSAREIGSAAVDMGVKLEGAGDNISDKFKVGVAGAVTFTEKRFDTFQKKFRLGAKEMGNSLAHPVKTIKDQLSRAVIGASDDVDRLGREASQTEKSLGNMGREGSDAGDKIKSAMTKAFLAFVGLKSIQQGVNTFKKLGGAALEAGKLTENVGAKFDVLFSGTDAASWASNYAAATKRSSTEIKSFLVSNQSMYRQMGITDKAAKDLSKVTTSLAYDFGNAFKMADADALSLVQGAIQGNAASMYEYGINLDDATLKTQALKMGISAQIDELDDASLAQIRMASLIEQTSLAQKAAIGQTDGLANSTKHLKGQWAEFMSDAGAKLTPAIGKFYGAISDAWPVIEPILMGTIGLLGSVFGLLGKIVDGASKAISSVKKIGSVRSAEALMDEGYSETNAAMVMAALPSHASGTKNFTGGWTGINERGGEVAFLPSGSAIIPADKSEQLLQNIQNNTRQSAFSPNLNLTVQGSADQSVIDQAMAAAEAMFKKLYEDYQRDEIALMTIKNAYT